MEAGDIPAAAAECDQLARLWTREAALTGAGLYLKTEDCNSVRHISAWLAVTEAPVAIEVQPGRPAEQLDGLRLHVPAMTAAERRQAWARDLGPLAQQMDGYLDRIAEYFHFEEPAIGMSAAAIREAADADPGALPGQLGWQICREHARRALDALAQRIEAKARWDDLVLPGAQVETLRQIAAHVRQRRWSTTSGDSPPRCPRPRHERAVLPARAAPARPWPPKCSPRELGSTCTASTSRRW